MSLQKIEELIYQRDCIKSLVEKTFESLQLMSDKLQEMDKEIKNFDRMYFLYKHLSKINQDEDKINNLQDNQKLKEILTLQFETSENFKNNAEKTINRIKDDFQQIVQVYILCLYFVGIRCA